MSNWVFRLTGMLIFCIIALIFVDKYLHPDVPDYLQGNIDVQTKDTPARRPAPSAEPNEPQLSLTSIEEDAPSPQPQINDSLIPARPTLNISALEEESVPVLSNPDAQRRVNTWLQAGSFSERANAEKRAAVLKAHSWSIEIEPAVVEGKTYYRVYVGPLNHEQVDGYLAKLNTMGINAREISR